MVGVTARLSVEEAAWILGFQTHDMAILPTPHYTSSFISNPSTHRIVSESWKVFVPPRAHEGLIAVQSA
jgi:hypothetical protein